MSAPAGPAAPEITKPRQWWRFLSVNDGVGVSSVISVFLIAYLANLGFSAMGQLNPFVLQSRLGIAPGVQGSATALLTVVQEIVAILVSGLMGVYADRLGRRAVLIAGGLLVAAGFLAVILATNFPALVAARALFALGMAALATTLFILNGDYPTATSRGRWIGCVAFVQASGSFTAVMTVTRLPGAFGQVTDNPAMVTAFTFLICAALGVLIIAAALMGIRKADDFRGTGVQRGALQHLGRGVAEARDPNIALGYAAGMASKADLVVINGFLFLWTVRFAADNGLPIDSGYATGRQIMMAAQLTFICSAPILGTIFDRCDRRVGVIIAFATAALAYLLMGMVDDPTMAGVPLRGMFVGFAEASAMVSAFALIADRTTTTNRGVVMGMFSTCGAFGMLIGAAAAGFLFDHWRYSAPYLMMSAINTCITIAAIVIWTLERRRAKSAPPHQ